MNRTCPLCRQQAHFAYMLLDSASSSWFGIRIGFKSQGIIQHLSVLLGKKCLVFKTFSPISLNTKTVVGKYFCWFWE